MTDIDLLVEVEMKKFHDAVVEKQQLCGSWIDAIVHQCDILGVEIEDCIGMVSPSIVAKLQQEGESRKMLKPDSHVRLDL